MEIYLPMKNCVRTKVHLTKNNGIVTYQQNRKDTMFYRWQRVDTTHDIIKTIKHQVNQKHLQEYPHNFQLLQKGQVT